MTVAIMAILLCVSIALNVVGGIVLRRYLERLFQYDELFDMLQNDLDDNIVNFDRINATPLLSNAPEIVHAAKLMKGMRDRLQTYALAADESARRESAERVTPRVTRGPEGLPRG